MGTQVAPLRLRLFLEGVEVPVVSAQVVAQGGQPAAASIQVVPTDAALLFLPRTLTHLFFLDPEPVSAEAESDRSIWLDDERYKLLYAGEIIGFSFNKSGVSRSMVLQCMDLSSYWDTCYQWFADFSVGGNGLTDHTHNFVGAGEYLFNNIASGTRWVLGNILSSRPSNPRYADTTGLLAGYIHLLETIGGLRPKADSYDGFRGVNDFFTVAELRYNLTAMVGAVEADTTSAGMYQAAAFRNWLQNGMASAGSLISYRDVLRLVGQYIFHDVYPNPVAYFQRGGQKRTVEVASTYKSYEVGKKFAQVIEPIVKSLDSARSSFSAIPHDAPGISYADGRDVLEDSVRKLRVAEEGAGQLASLDKSVVRAKINEAINYVNEAVRELNGIARRGHSGEDEITQVQGRSIADTFSRAVEILEGVLGTKVKASRVKKDVETADHLFNQLILPETFFVPPPRCNVIFPDQYTQFSFSRNFLREVTRLSCQAGLGIIAGNRRNAEILGRHYLAPNIQDVKGRMAREILYQSGTSILPHEVHSGIIPKFEWVTEGHRWASQGAKEAGENAETRKIAYIQRLANMQFFTHRWNARSMSLVGRFNPMIVLGLPAVVIDRGAPSPSALEAIADALGSGLSILPTAYIGKVEQYSHDVNQGGGTTSIAFSRARTHRGFDDEFLGVLQRERQDLVEESEMVSVSDVLDASRSGGANELHRKIVQDYFADLLGTGRKFDSERSVKRVELSGDTVVLSRSDALLLGVPETTWVDFVEKTGTSSRQPTTAEEVFLLGTALAGELIDTVEVPAVITAVFDVRSNRGRFVTPEGAPPPEIVLKPGWYSDAWSPPKISSEVYQPLLGTVAITDDSTVGDADSFLETVRSYAASSGEDGPRLEISDVNGASLLRSGDKTLVTFDVEEGTSTIEGSIDALTMFYSTLRNQGLNVEQFIRDYTGRPVASINDILGSRFLEYDAGGKPRPLPDGTLPREGFHSRAFGDYNTDVKYSNLTDEAPTPGKDAFVLLLTDDERQNLTKSATKDGVTLPPIPKHLDPRGRAQQRVKAYAAELRLSRGLAAT